MYMFICFARTKIVKEKEVVAELYRRRAKAEIELMEQKILGGRKLDNRRSKETRLMRSKKELESLYHRLDGLRQNKKYSQVLLEAQADTFRDHSEIFSQIEAKKNQEAEKNHNFRESLRAFEHKEQEICRIIEDVLEKNDSLAYVISVAKDELNKIDIVCGLNDEKKLGRLEKDISRFQMKCEAIEEKHYAVNSELQLLRSQNSTYMRSSKLANPRR